MPGSFTSLVIYIVISRKSNVKVSKSIGCAEEFLREEAQPHLPRAVYRRIELCYTVGMKAYSQDLRQRVLRAVDAGQTQAEIAKTFAVSVATIKRYLKQRREIGHVQPKAIPGRPAKKGAVLQAHLRAQLEAHPDATREEHCQLFKTEQGIEVSTASISRARAALDWTRKKRPSLLGNRIKRLERLGASKPAG